MNLLLYALSLAALLQAAPLSGPAPTPTTQQTVKLPARGKSLFNGKDLAGWHTDVPAMDRKDPAVKTPFIVRKGLLVSLGNPGGHLITDASYQNYRLELEYRFAGKPGNCGALVHVSRPRALYEMFPKSIEVQMMHQNAGDFWCIEEDIAVPDMEKRRGPKEKWGVNGDKLRRIPNLTDGSEKALGEWNAMTIECLGDQVKVWVNGDLVNHGFNATASSGRIALQAEGSEVEFRKVYLRPISKLH
ncbi:MAG: 3-keto-disaccharide hydrolase [Adhaeribacter sp.]